MKHLHVPFYGQVLRLVWPIVQQSLLSSVVNSADVVMLRFVGQTAVSAVSNLLIAGMFRAGGDSRHGLVCNIFVMWCYAVPLALLSAFVFKLPVLWVYALFCTDEFMKWPWIIRRYRSGRWIKDITRNNLFEGVPK